MPEANELRFSILIPVRNDRQNLVRVLEALRSADLSDSELLICDDGSIPPLDALGLGKFACATALYRVAGWGPARARNFLSEKARGDFLLFLDSDTEPLPDTIATARKIVTENPQFDAFVGSYDDSPRNRSLVSCYKNLSHHFVHQNSGRRVSTFWCGCGIVRRSVFVEEGGLNEGYRYPSVEDIEFGMRISRNGRNIGLHRELQVRHLKSWTLGQWIRTDLFRRGIPWIRLMASRRQWLNELNLSTGGRISAFAAIAFLISLFLVPLKPASSLLTAALLGLFVSINRKFFRFLARREGLGRALLMIPLHMTYYLMACASLGIGLAQAGLYGAPRLQLKSFSNKK